MVYEYIDILYKDNTIIRELYRLDTYSKTI